MIVIAFFSLPRLLFALARSLITECLTVLFLFLAMLSCFTLMLELYEIIETPDPYFRDGDESFLLLELPNYL